MFIHNKKKKFALFIVNIIVELICLPWKIFNKRNELQNLNPQKILLVRLDHIGDVVMTTPSFSLIRGRFPKAKILLLTNGAGKSLLKDDLRIDEILVFNWPWSQPKVKGRFSWSKMKELKEIILKLRRENIDVFVDFRGDLRFVFLFGVLTGARFRVSNSRSGKSSLLHHTSDYDISKHEVERSTDVVKCFVSNDTPLRPNIYLSDEEICKIRQLLECEIKRQLPNKIAVIAPYSSRDVKSWPVAYFRKVISHLKVEGFIILIVGTRDDKTNADEMLSDFQEDVFSLAGKTSIRELAALVSISSIVVGVDTGVLHLASCFDVPIIAIFGSTRSTEFRPYSPFVSVVDSNTCTCNQFLHLKCDHAVDGYAECLSQLAPARVIEAIEISLKNTPDQGALS